MSASNGPNPSAVDGPSSVRPNWRSIPIRCCWPMRRQAEFNAIDVPENQQLVPYNSSRWGWLAAQIYTGVSSPIWGTLTFGRQNTPLTDAVGAYDPMGGAYAFSVIGNSGMTCGDGDTETCRWTTAIKYRVNIGRLPAVWLPDSRSVAPPAAMTHITPITARSKAASAGTSRALVRRSLRGRVGRLGERRGQLVDPVPRTNTRPWLARPRSPLAASRRRFPTIRLSWRVAKYSFGSWGSPPSPIVGKSAPAPSGPTGIPLTFYAGYE